MNALRIRTVAVSLSMAAVSAAALAGAVAAQGVEFSNGVFVAGPAAVSLTAGPSHRGADVFVKPAGFQSSPPPRWQTNGGGGPDFDLQAILAVHGGGSVDVDAMSIGEDWILADDQTGRIAVPRDRWGLLTFSVRRGTRGTPESQIGREFGAPGGNFSDIYEYVLPGSALPSEFVGRTRRIVDNTETGLGPDAPDLDALDQHVPLWQPQVFASLQAQEANIYFSVSPETLGDVPGLWWDGTLPSAATVFIVPADPRARPRVWMAYDAFQLPQEANIDALAIDLPNERIVYSTTEARLDPIMFVYFGTDTTTPTPLKTPGGRKVSNEIGLVVNDDIDAVCAIDPSALDWPLTNGGRHRWFHFSGYPQPPILFPEPEMHASVIRGTDSTNQDILFAHVVGWPNGNGPSSGLAAYFVTPGLSPGPFFPLGAALPRDVTPVFAGDPKQFRVVVPPAAAFSGTAVFRAFALDTASGDLDEAWPVRFEI